MRHGHAATRTMIPRHRHHGPSNHPAHCPGCQASTRGGTQAGPADPRGEAGSEDPGDCSWVHRVLGGGGASARKLLEAGQTPRRTEGMAWAHTQLRGPFPPPHPVPTRKLKPSGSRVLAPQEASPAEGHHWPQEEPARATRHHGTKPEGPAASLGLPAPGAKRAEAAGAQRRPAPTRAALTSPAAAEAGKSERNKETPQSSETPGTGRQASPRRT